MSLILKLYFFNHNYCFGYKKKFFSLLFTFYNSSIDFTILSISPLFITNILSQFFNVISLWATMLMFYSLINSIFFHYFFSFKSISLFFYSVPILPMMIIIFSFSSNLLTFILFSIKYSSSKPFGVYKSLFWNFYNYKLHYF